MMAAGLCLLMSLDFLVYSIEESSLLVLEDGRSVEADRWDVVVVDSALSVARVRKEKSGMGERETLSSNIQHLELVAFQLAWSLLL